MNDPIEDWMKLREIDAKKGSHFAIDPIDVMKLISIIRIYRRANEFYRTSPELAFTYQYANPQASGHFLTGIKLSDPKERARVAESSASQICKMK